jgi:hypothetical protein
MIILILTLFQSINKSQAFLKSEVVIVAVKSEDELLTFFKAG